MMLFALGSIAEAKTIPKKRSEDVRIREVFYNETQVVEVPTAFGFATTIEFGNEVIKTAVSGDTIGWQVVPQGNRLFIKPAEKVQDGLKGTNITVITDKRNYYLHVFIASRTDPVFVIRYRYDKPAPPPTATYIEDDEQVSTSKKTKLTTPYKNFKYQMTGSKAIAVKKVFDDGQFTYFEFDPRKPLPAIYIVNNGGYEELVNTRQEGKYVVVEKVGSLFTLRDGDIHKCVSNQAMPFIKENRNEPVKNDR